VTDVTGVTALSSALAHLLHKGASLKGAALKGALLNGALIKGVFMNR